MKKEIYHGSNKIIEKPVFGYGKKYNDYGLGFYCTEEIDMAKEWGVRKNCDGYANIYEIDCNDLRILNLNDGNHCIMNWLAVLLQNREFDIPGGLALEAKEYILNHFMVDYENFDIIIGYRADDSYFSFAQDFINGTISYRQLKNAMYLGKLGSQFVIKSKEAFSRLIYKGNIVADKQEWYTKKENRDKTARREYFDTERNKRRLGDLFITAIIDEEMKQGDERLR